MQIIKIKFNESTEQKHKAMLQQVQHMREMEIIFRPDDCEHTTSREWLYCHEDYLFDCAACHT